VRATHVPTGPTTVSKEQRSQHANKCIARVKLRLLLEARRSDGAGGEKQGRWQQDHAFEKGNAVRVYRGAGFKRMAGVS